MKRDQTKFIQAKIMRQQGVSIRTIARKLNISTSTASLWCRDIKLSVKLISKLNLKGSSSNLLRKYAHKRHTDKITRHQDIFKKSTLEIGKLNTNEAFLVGVALYWAEGFKSLREQRVGFVNSDPRMVKFIISWFKNSLKIPSEDITLRAEFNNVHINRRQEIENYWSHLTDIPLTQFNKPYLQKINKTKTYPTKKDYYGALRIRIRRSSELLVQLRGWIEGLAPN